jgi:hypothetical protein
MAAVALGCVKVNNMDKSGPACLKASAVSCACGNLVYCAEVALSQANAFSVFYVNGREDNH